jgi:hypothetical protein
MSALEFRPLADIFPLVEGQDFAETRGRCPRAWICTRLSTRTRFSTAATAIAPAVGHAALTRLPTSAASQES